MPIFIPKSLKSASIVFLLFTIVMAILFCVSTVFYAVYASKLEKYGDVDINNFSREEIVSGMPVDGELTYVVDYFAEEYETKNGIRTSSSSSAVFYLVPVVDENNYISYFIVYKGFKKDFITLDAMVNEFWAAEYPANPTMFTMEDKQIVELPDEINGYLDEYLYQVESGKTLLQHYIDNGWFDTSDVSEARTRFLPYMIVNAPDVSLIYVFGGLMLVLLIVTLILFLILRKRRQAAQEAEYQASLNPEYIPADAPDYDTENTGNAE